MEQNKAKEIPYGVSDFVTIVEQNIYYVDKTMYIPELENQARNLFFIRPRRFGKSVFLGMLHAYYDIRTKDKFQQWFGNLWIGHYLNGYINNGSAPKEMVDHYTRTELKNLFPSDKYAEFRKDTIRQLLSEGIIRTTLIDTYSIYELLKPDLLASLLFYKGVLTISGTLGSMSVLSIPNKNNQELYGKVFQEIMAK